MAVNRLMVNRLDVLHGEGWVPRLNLSRRDMGTGMTDEEVAEFSARVDIAALRGYSAAVGRRTQEIVRSLCAEELDDVPDAAMLLAAERAPVAGVYLVARQDVTEPGHLHGGRIGVLSETGQLAISARAILREWGITATLVPLGTLPKIYEALRAQYIDAGMLTEEYHRAAQRALGLTAFPIPATGLPPVLATTRRLIHRRRGLVARVVQGYVETIHLFKTNRALVLPLLHRFLQHFDQETVEDIYAFYAPQFQQLPLPSAVVIQQLLNEFAATYPVAHTLPPTAVTDTSVLEELEQSGLVARLYGGV